MHTLWWWRNLTVFQAKEPPDAHFVARLVLQEHETWDVLFTWGLGR